MSYAVAITSRAGYMDNQIAVLLGHSQASTTAGYGELPQGAVTMLHGMIEAVSFEFCLNL